MRDRVNKWNTLFRFSLAPAWIVLAFLAVWPLGAVPAEALERPERELQVASSALSVLQSEPCEIPASPLQINAAIGVTVVGQGPGAETSGAPQLVITCLRFDRGSYPLDTGWQAEVVVQNIGNSASAPFTITGTLCRNLADGIAFQCMSSSVYFLASDQPGLSPGESRLSQSNTFGFSLLPTDDPALYPSWEPGLPDNGVVYLRARLDGMPQGQHYVTQAVYPSAPTDESGAANFVDQDLDGWNADPTGPGGWDCDDADPDVHPGALEVAGDGLDNDCEGGDTSLAGPCEAYYGTYYGEAAFCGQPGTYLGPGGDADGDGYFVSDSQFDVPDCDDTNPFVNPGMAELPDGIDNNCNGLIDETWATADWRFDSFTLFRDFMPVNLNAYQSVNLPALRYEVTIGNAGDFMGDDLSFFQAVSVVSPVDGTVATGTSGFIPYGELANGRDYACQSTGLLAQISTSGINGEVNFTNNTAVASLPNITPPDRELRFAGDPALIYNSGSTGMLLITNGEVLGTCPPLPTRQNGVEFVEVRNRVIVNNDIVFEATLDGISYTPPVSLSSSLANRDVVCIEITLDPNRYILEDHSDNMFVRVLEYRNPLIGQTRFDELDRYLGAPAAVSYPPGWCNPQEIGAAEGALVAGQDTDPGATGGGLIGGSPLLGGALLGAVLVTLVGGVGAGVAGVARSGMGWIVAGGLLVGSVGGGILGETLARPQRASPANESAAIAIDPLTDDGIPSCDLYLDPGSAYPREGASVSPFRRAFTLSVAFSPNAPEPRPTLFRVGLTAPSGREALLETVVSEGDDRLRLGAGEALAQLGSDLLAEAGEFTWSVESGQVGLGGDLNPFEQACAGSSEHSFVVEQPPTGSPTLVPTPTATQTATSYIPLTSTPIQPTRTPKPSSVPTKPPPKPTKPSG